MAGDNKLAMLTGTPVEAWWLTGLRWAFWLLTPSPLVVFVSLWVLARSSEAPAKRRAWFGLLSGLAGTAAMLLALAHR